MLCLVMFLWPILSKDSQKSGFQTNKQKGKIFQHFSGHFNGYPKYQLTKKIAKCLVTLLRAILSKDR